MADLLITIGFCLLFAAAGFIAGWQFKALSVEPAEYAAEAARDAAWDRDLPAAPDA